MVTPGMPTIWSLFGECCCSRTTTGETLDGGSRKFIAGLPPAAAGGRGGGGMDIDLDPLKIVDGLGRGITEGIRGISDALAPPGAAGGRPAGKVVRESRM